MIVANLFQEEKDMTNFELKPWKTEYAESMRMAADNPKVAANLRNVFPNPYSIEDANFYINMMIEAGEEKQLARAIVIDGKAVGSVGVFVQGDVYEKSAELGYWLSEDYWRQGIMSCAVKQICKEAFEKFDIVRIYAKPYASNKGSRGVLEKVGFTYEGTMRNGVYKHGKLDSYCMYSLLKEEI